MVERAVPHPSAVFRRALVRSLLVVIATCAIPLVSADADLEAGFANTRTDMAIKAVSVRGPYLEIQLETKGDVFFTYVEPNESCRAVASGESLAYIDNGPLGVLRVDETDCQVYGVGNLRLWRDRRSGSTRDSTRTVPRSQAKYRTLYRDHEVALLRGSFPQAARLRFTGFNDLIAVVPIERVCEKPIDEGVASIEFRPKGTDALALVGSDGLCTILGLVNPLPESTPRAPE